MGAKKKIVGFNLAGTEEIEDNSQSTNNSSDQRGDTVGGCDRTSNEKNMREVKIQERK